MAESTPTPPASSAPAAPPRAGSSERDPGAPVEPGAIDPELIKLRRPRPKVGLITAAGLVFLCIFALIRLTPDRRFAGHGSAATPAQPADILAGKVDLDQLVTVAADPLASHAIRVTRAAGTLGLRLAPFRGTGDRLWLATTGDGSDPPVVTGYTGRLRKLDDLAFAAAARAYSDEHPRPAFATAAAVRSAFATGRVVTVAGDSVSIADRDEVALDVVDPAAATIAASLTLRDVAAWRAELSRAGITPTAVGEPNTAIGQVRFSVAAPVSITTAQLEKARLFGARVEPVTRHHQTTWATLRRSPPAGLDVGGATLPDDQIDLIGLHVLRGIPHDAYAIVTGESPDDYWYVLPITIALAATMLVFAWALVRAIRRDLWPARAG